MGFRKFLLARTDGLYNRPDIAGSDFNGNLPLFHSSSGERAFH